VACNRCPPRPDHTTFAHGRSLLLQRDRLERARHIVAAMRRSLRDDDTVMAERWKELQRAARRVCVLAPALAALACSGDGAEPRVDEPSEESVAGLREAAIPLETVEPATSAADLEPVRALIGDTRVVVLGE